MPERKEPGGALLESYRDALRVTRHYAKSFYFSSFPLPKLKRLRAYAIYAFCRYCDDWIDRAPPGSRLDATQELRALTGRLYAGKITTDDPAWAAAFSDTVRTCSVPLKLCEDLIHGVCLDAGGHVRLKNFSELTKYCYYVASVVGLLMNCVFEPVDPSAAHDPAISLGQAMQMTNILRDVREDALIGRCYLPADELEQAGLAGSDFTQPGTFRKQQWRIYAQFFATRALQQYAQAEPGILLLPDDGSRYCVRCMSRIYAGILDQIRQADWDVSMRRYVPLWKKVLLVIQAGQR